MFHFNLFLIASVIMLTFHSEFAAAAQKKRVTKKSNAAQAQQVSATPSPTPMPTPASTPAPVAADTGEVSTNKDAAPEAPKKVNRFESLLGVGYEFFEDAVKINDAFGDEEGIGDYSGLSFRYTANWAVNRWYIPVVFNLGFGKATAGQFVSGTALPERLWSQPSIEFAGLYRFTPRFGIGPGVTAYYRTVNWQSEPDVVPAITSTSKTKFGYGPELVARLDFGERFSLVQTAVLLEAKNHSLWQWIIQYRM